MFIRIATGLESTNSFDDFKADSLVDNKSTRQAVNERSDTALIVSSISLQAAPNFDVNEKLFPFLQAVFLARGLFSAQHKSCWLFEFLESYFDFSLLLNLSPFRAISLNKEVLKLLLVCSWSWKNFFAFLREQIKLVENLPTEFYTPKKRAKLYVCRLQFHFF